VAACTTSPTEKVIKAAPTATFVKFFSIVLSVVEGYKVEEKLDSISYQFLGFPITNWCCSYRSFVTFTQPSNIHKSSIELVCETLHEGFDLILSPK
jgi:hypothetical protein